MVWLLVSLVNNIVGEFQELSCCMFEDEYAHRICWLSSDVFSLPFSFSLEMMSLSAQAAENHNESKPPFCFVLLHVLPFAGLWLFNLIAML